MKDEGYMAVICAVLYGCKDDEEDDASQDQLLDHIRDVFDVAGTKHERLLTVCIHMICYRLQVVAHVHSKETILLYIYNEQNCRQYAVDKDEIYLFDVGYHTNFKLKFDVVPFIGKNRKRIQRSGLLLKRIMMLERKEPEYIDLSSLPIDTLVKKSVSVRGHQYTVDLKMMKKVSHEAKAQLGFDDLLEMTKLLHEYNAEGKSGNYTGELSDKSLALLCRTADFLHIPSEVVKIALLSVFLVWDNSRMCLDETAMIRLVKQLRERRNFVKSDILDTALSHLAECLVAEFHDIVQKFSHKELFPPSDYHILRNINTALKIVVDICVLPIWGIYTSQDPSAILTEKLISMVVESVEKWMSQEFHPYVRDVKEFCITIQTMWEMMQRNYQTYSLFFHQFNVNYVEVALKTIDEKLESFARSYLSERLMHLDSRKTSELEIFTKCTMRFYDTLHSLSDFGRKNSVENLLMYDFETWFLDVTVFWTYSWRDVSLKMVSRTISLDNDGDAAKSIRRLFDVGIQAAQEYDDGIMSENIYAYAKKLHSEALSSESDKNSRMIRAVNGVEQALLFVSERWRRFVDFDRMLAVLPFQEAAAIEKSCVDILENTRKRCELIMDRLLRLYCHSMHDDVARIARNVTIENYEHSKKLTAYVRDVSPAEKLYQVLDSVDRLVCDIRGDLLSRCSQIALQNIHRILETEVIRCLRRSRNPEYYSEIYMTLKEIINVLGVPLDTSEAAPLLHLCSFTTDELILSYYDRMSEEMYNSQEDNVPRIKIQIGYMSATGDNALIVVHVLGLENVLELNTLYDRIEPFVKLELLPSNLYSSHCFPIQKTRTITQHEGLSWSQDFQFLVPLQLFYLQGSSLCISVLDHDRFNDELIGRTLLATSKLPRMDSLSIKKLPPVRSVHLVQPSVGHKLPHYKMLKQRSAYDRVARAFLRREKDAHEMYLKGLSRRSSTRIKCFKEQSK